MVESCLVIFQYPTRPWKLAADGAVLIRRSVFLHNQVFHNYVRRRTGNRHPGAAILDLMLRRIVCAPVRPDVDPAVWIIEILLAWRQRLRSRAVVYVRHLVVEQIFGQIAAREPRTAITKLLPVL